jgi:peptide-methionine (R)-S-oxide reductase
MFDSDCDHDQLTKPGRRAFLTLSGSSIPAFALWFLSRGRGGDARGAEQEPHEVTIVQFSEGGKRLGKVRVPKVIKTEEEWRKQLPPGVFEITRHADTEMAFTGKYWNLHEKGLYRCICCENALFSSETKFESGTGWPSFWTPIAKENVQDNTDRSLGMARTAVSCTQCDAHLGHVFDDGPQPTGLRYCMNSASLNFVKAR